MGASNGMPHRADDTRGTRPRSLSDIRVGWIGLGRMGAPMAARLLDSGVDLAVYNRTTAKADPLVERGATRLGSVAEAGECEVVFSMVLDDAVLGELHDPRTGLFSRSDGRRIAVWIDGSTVSAQAAERAADAARAAGVAYVSAPVSGNPAVVEAGNAVFVLSGDEAGLDLAEDLTRRIGRQVFRAGAGAEANVIKLCVNAVLAVTMQALAEVAVLADKAGVSRAALMTFLNESAIGSPFTRYKTDNLVALRFPPTFTPEGQRKDIRLALDLARRTETPMPVLNTTETAYSRLISGGLGEGRDFAALVLAVARDAGHALEPEEDRE
ncbi:3-hydroxy acid dehydrogenase [Sphaerisporangium krabiense]|uniref:3-hydroxyisobutyrate dehydrogenase-like beta-hydroxyacid dehydrogenase n=1 Tax=Sphaerisporangium krabiense TaxID=763782 RepID=A0A7W8Z0C9_9ACTN|nr:NAD(P)-dependent oxidoreductase [Sphaerisporangium krabiense]MBB5625139.1 3-hydroxyisobutyrate dehydrogenase-like beta-hydroxyacid dehydrogenase [Sphaerisporangium krabiense]GII64352.1 3-hydroxy acid dehydrogenase [Sphaerisporangium krabiense]